MKKIFKILSYILKGIIGFGLLFGILLLITGIVQFIVNWLISFKTVKIILTSAYFIVAGSLLFFIGLGLFLAIEEKVKEYFKNRKREKRNYE